MSNLHDFLHPVTEKEETEIVVSKRFIKHDESGEPALDSAGKEVLRPFRVRAITQEENDALVRSCTRTHKDRNGSVTKELDREAYSRALVVAGTVDPDFKSKELCDAFGVVDPQLVPGKMLYAGEYQKLADAIADISGIGTDIEAEAKN